MIHVLLAEDYPEFASRIAALLEPIEAKVRHAADGRQAVAWVEDRRVAIDLVITDLTMPLRTGWHVIEAVHAHRVGVPVILQSGEADDRWVQEEARRLGVPLIAKRNLDSELLWVIRQTDLLTRPVEMNRNRRASPHS